MTTITPGQATLNLAADVYDALDGRSHGEQFGPSPLTWLAGVVTEYAVLAEQDLKRRAEAGEVVDWEAYHTAVGQATGCIRRLQDAVCKAEGRQ